MYSVQYATPAIILLSSLFGFLFIFFIIRAQRGKKPRIRKIAGLAAIEDAVGRATEMGRPMMYTAGLVGIDPVCMASMGILKSIARSAAKYDTRIIVSIYDPTTYPYIEEVCRQGYTEGGKPNLFSPDDIRFISSDQFAFASGTVGIMHREKVAANFMMGNFAAESLILAETGQQIGAIQVAGTLSYMQLPFFITTCDYTIIGEEFFAGSAYLTQEPVLLGSLFGQDLAKMIILAILVVGTIYSTKEGLDDKVKSVTKNPVFQAVLGRDKSEVRGDFNNHLVSLSEGVRFRAVAIALDEQRLGLFQDPGKLRDEKLRLLEKRSAIEQDKKKLQEEARSRDNLHNIVAVLENRLNNVNAELGQMEDGGYIAAEIARLKGRITAKRREMEAMQAEIKSLVGSVLDMEDTLKTRVEEERRSRWARMDELERQIIDMELRAGMDSRIQS